ncbi:MAG TPA: hypothetical protein PLA91_03120 [Bacillota bacterium]|nr:hypothetical protein [Peptococcaceae bacterium MAG4]HPU35767.1 hypothetical protein [Bacillota bacterium]
MVLLFLTGCSIWTASQNKGERERPLVIKPEDFSIFLFESSEEIYRANVKDSGMWEKLRDLAAVDEDYAIHYNWLYDTYNSWDEYRRAQLHEIMTEYHPHPMAEQLIQNGRQEAGLDEIIAFIREDRFFGKMRNTLVDFYSWYGSNYALPHYQQVRPLLERKAQSISALVEKEFDIVSFLEKETGITLKEKPEGIELLLNMRIIGASGFYRDKVSLTTIQWNATPEKIWATPFHEMSHPFFRTFTGSLYFKYLASKLKKDEELMKVFKEEVPHTWEGWIEENLVEGFARYLNVRKGIARDVGEGIYVFDREFAQALADGFDPQKISLEDFTIQFLKQKYDL